MLRKLFRRIGIAVAAVAGVLTVAYFVLFPKPELIKPMGANEIGTLRLDVVDPKRKEIYSKTDELRRFPIQIWYPAVSTAGKQRASWLYHGKQTARALARDINVPGFLFDRLASVASHSYIDAPMAGSAPQKFPVVIISHGWSGISSLHTDIAEELASHGYVVVAIDHSYGAPIAVLNDGTAIYKNPEALQWGNPNFLAQGRKLVDTYAGDIATTIDYLTQLNDGRVVEAADDAIRSAGYETVVAGLAGRLDLERIGVVGHSTGGGAGVKLALNDPRIKAVLGMDAWVEPIVPGEVERGLRVPSLFLRSAAWETGANNENLARLVAASKPESLVYQVNGTSHYDFALVRMYSPLLRWLGISGKIDETEREQIVRGANLAFFDGTLRGSQSSIGGPTKANSRVPEGTAADTSAAQKLLQQHHATCQKIHLSAPPK